VFDGFWSLMPGIIGARREPRQVPATASSV